MNVTHEYAFDVDLHAVVRVTARSEADAREAMECALTCMDLTTYAIDGINSKLAADLKITEASLVSEHPELFELDGQEIE